MVAARHVAVADSAEEGGERDTTGRSTRLHGGGAMGSLPLGTNPQRTPTVTPGQGVPGEAQTMPQVSGDGEVGSNRQREAEQKKTPTGISSTCAKSVAPLRLQPPSTHPLGCFSRPLPCPRSPSSFPTSVSPRYLHAPSFHAPLPAQHLKAVQCTPSAALCRTP